MARLAGSSLLRRLLAQWPWLLPATLCALWAIAPPAALDRISAATEDALTRSAAHGSPDPRIVVVDIDERSLSILGQWPWRRDRVAALIDRLRDAGARVIALDLVFRE